MIRSWLSFCERVSLRFFVSDVGPHSAWTSKVSRYSGMLQAAGTRFNLLPVPLSTIGGWHPDAHRALCSVANTIAARGLSTFSRARGILFQRHAALLVTNNALRLMSGLLSDLRTGSVRKKHETIVFQ